MAEWLEVSASEAVSLDLIPSRVQPMALKMVFTAFLFDAQHKRYNVENKQASLLVVPLGKALSGILSSWSGRQKAGNSYSSSLQRFDRFLEVGG